MGIYNIYKPIAKIEQTGSDSHRVVSSPMISSCGTMTGLQSPLVSQMPFFDGSPKMTLLSAIYNAYSRPIAIKYDNNYITNTVNVYDSPAASWITACERWRRDQAIGAIPSPRVCKLKLTPQWRVSVIQIDLQTVS